MPATETISGYDVTLDNRDHPAFEDVMKSACERYIQLLDARDVLTHSYARLPDECSEFFEAEISMLCIIIRDCLCNKFGRPPLLVSL